MGKIYSMMKWLCKKIFEMDDMTYEIYRQLKHIHHSDMSYKEKQNKLKEFLGEVYCKYDSEDIVKRKLYLQSKLDSQNAIYFTIGVAVWTWAALETSKLVVTYIATKTVSGGDLFPYYFAAFFTLIIGYPFSHLAGRYDAKYRKYNLIDFELEIINEILEKEFYYSKTIQDIINARFEKGNPLYKRDKRIKCRSRRNHCCRCKKGWRK